jgi:hypothetical protein
MGIQEARGAEVVVVGASTETHSDWSQCSLSSQGQSHHGLKVEDISKNIINDFCAVLNYALNHAIQ